MKITTTVFYMLLSCALFSQNKVDLTGTVADSTGNPLAAATVVLLQKADSIMVGFGITGNEGQFKLDRIASGEYLLQVSYIGYNTHYENVNLNSVEGDLNLPNILLSEAAENLDAVTVKAEHIPIQMKNDTVEYNAAAFKVQPGSAVEDLLKKLPGVEVDREGNIKAQGENINQVLVDGKEFFGNDPKIATKNLPADAVDKVQVFDKKSDMAEFSGIDDGNEQKTINLELKDGKKNGYFGNIEGGYGTDDRYQGKVNVNRFNKKSQLSLIGMANNVNEQGFSLNEYIDFMGGLSNFMNSAGGSGGRVEMNLGESGLPLSMGMQDGIMETLASGLNFNRDFGKKTELTSSYFYNKVENELIRNTTRENLLGENAFNSASQNTQIMGNDNHRLNLNLRHKIDSMSNLIFRSSAGYSDSEMRNFGNGNTFDSNGNLTNTSFQNNSSTGENLNLRSSLVYRRKFDKAGRIFVANGNYSYRDNANNANVFSENEFIDSSQIITNNQRQIQNEDLQSWRGGLSYTEPIGKAGKSAKYLEINYSHEKFDNKLKKDFNDVLGSDEVFNPNLSRNYEQDYSYDRAGLNFRLNKKKLKLTFGGAMQLYRLNGMIISDDFEVSQEQWNFLPTARFSYDFGSATDLGLDYDTNIRQPSLEQLQPIVDNSNPLNLYIGNANLKPEYRHNFGMSFMKFSQFTNTSVFLNLNATYTTDKITNSKTIDDNFIQTITPINVKDDWNMRSYLSFGTPLKFIKSRINFNVNTDFSRSILFVNNLENEVKRLNNSLELTIDNRKKDIVDLMVGAEIGISSTKYSINKEQNQNYLDQTFFADATINLGKKTTLGSSFDYTVYSDESFGETENVPLWRASITQFIFEKKGRIKLSVFDILDKNNGFRRSSDLNFVQTVESNVLGRYFMLTFGWSLSGFGERKSGIQIETARRRG